MAHLTVGSKLSSAATSRSSPASTSGRCNMASIRIPTFTARQPVHNGNRRRGSAKILAYRGGNCGDSYGRGPAWRGGPFQMNPNDMMAAGGAIADMMEMARRWQASNPGFPQNGGGDSSSSMQLPLAVDLEESEELYTLTADVPGLQKSDLKITVNQKDRTLTVSGERKRAVKASPEPVNGQEQQQGEAKQQQFRQRFERIMGKFQRTLSRLPEDADLSAVSARVEKGVLSITVQKTERTRYNDYVEINID